MAEALEGCDVLPDPRTKARRDPSCPAKPGIHDVGVELAAAEVVDARASRGHHGERGAWAADHLADLAVAALIAEAELTPKPGLVDRRGAGSHADMELATLVASAEALRPTFVALAYAADGATPSQALREDLARIGREGEVAMLATTGGVNTHRGAIWALGLIAAAAAIEGPGATSEAICATAGAIACFPDRFAPGSELNGARACRTYRVSGARGEASAGFPHALLALDALRRFRATGRNEAASRIDALLVVMTVLDDTCLLHRGGRRALRVARLGARAALSAGGAGSSAGMVALRALDRRLLALNASPGGAADMLAAALLLDALTGDRDPGSALCAMWDDALRGEA